MNIRGLLNANALVASLVIAAAVTAFVSLKIRLDLMPLPESLNFEESAVRKVQILDRWGIPLTVTYENDWNIHDYRALHEIPLKLREIFVFAEDKRFFKHNGADWTARIGALRQNALRLRFIRGASTITEQTVRMLHPRPRTVWSRWLEGIEAKRLEKRFSKAQILEFYLNEVPYAAKRRGVAQAAHYYFDRDLDTLNLKEMLALAALVRSPARMDLHKDVLIAENAIKHLARRMLEENFLTEDDYKDLSNDVVILRSPDLPQESVHFVNYVFRQGLDRLRTRGRLFTTIDSFLQGRVKKILDVRLKDLQNKGATDGAVIVIDHTSNEVLVWVNAGGYSTQEHGSHIDMVMSPRQPGSTLKPFLYSLALEKGWTPATLINDSPISLPVSTGLHAVHNYSRIHYGDLRLRDALGNSLNVPAVRTAEFVGADKFLKGLRSFGFDSLKERADYYGQGLALGNGEVTLFELARAYSTIARGGVYAPLKFVTNSADQENRRQVVSEETSSIIADILSDSEARRLEFGSGGVFPQGVAVKTGTSTDYRDAWAIGFSSRYTVGVWMGNLDRKPMKDITGSRGPLLVLRMVFTELARFTQEKPLFLSPKLKGIRVCKKTGRLASPSNGCPTMLEWFKHGSEPRIACDLHNRIGAAASAAVHNDLSAGFVVSSSESDLSQPLRLIQPTQGLQLAMDPRIPDELEAFAFIIPDIKAEKIEWVVDGKVAGHGADRRFFWKLERGSHRAMARLWVNDITLETPSVGFYVK